MDKITQAIFEGLRQWNQTADMEQLEPRAASLVATGAFELAPNGQVLVVGNDAAIAAAKRIDRHFLEATGHATAAKINGERNELDPVKRARLRARLMGVDLDEALANTGEIDGSMFAGVDLRGPKDAA